MWSMLNDVSSVSLTRFPNELKEFMINPENVEVSGPNYKRKIDEFRDVDINGDDWTYYDTSANSMCFRIKKK